MNKINIAHHCCSKTNQLEGSIEGHIIPKDDFLKGIKIISALKIGKISAMMKSKF